MSAETRRLLGKLENISIEILASSRKKALNEEFIEKYCYLLKQLLFITINDDLLPKKLYKELYYTCLQILIESNYAKEQKKYLECFTKVRELIISVLCTDSKDEVTKVVQEIIGLEKLIQDEIKKYNMISEHTFKDLTNILKGFEHNYREKNELPKKTMGTIFRVCTQIIIESNYFKSPEPKALIRRNPSDTKEPIVTQFWKIEELMGSAFGLDY